jgi:translation initiation factor 5
MAQLLNVDPQKQNDAFYRYKMPSILIKIEGNGNGIKTVFPNIRDVCARLGRPAEILYKYFGYELGAQSTHLKQDDKFLVMGSFTQQRVQERVFDFVTRFVLCKECRNPETTPLCKTKTKLVMTCKSCGKETDLTSAGNERVVQLMLTFYSQVKNANAAGAMMGAAEKTEEAPDAKPEETVPAAVSTGPVKIETTAEQLKKVNPILELANLMRQLPPSPAEKVIHRALQLKTELNLSESNMTRTVFRAVLEGVEANKFIGALQQWRPVLKHFITVKEQVTALKELGLAVKKYDAIEKFPMALKMLWEEDLVGEAQIMEWHTTYKPSGKDMPPETFEQIKAKTKPVIDWLSQ